MSRTWRSPAARCCSRSSSGGKTPRRRPRSPACRRVDRTRRFTVEGDDAARLDLLVARRLDLSRSQAATLIANGAVLVDGRRQKASFKAEDGNEVVVELPAAASRTVEGEDIPLSVVFEDDA